MGEPKATRRVVITNPQGLHARPADLLVRLANQFAAKVDITKDRQRVDGKSILSLLMLAAECGTTLELEAVGPDADAAVSALASLIERNFDEQHPQAGEET